MTPNEHKAEPKDKGKQVKKLTWLQKMWAEVPDSEKKRVGEKCLYTGNRLGRPRRNDVETNSKGRRT